MFIGFSSINFKKNIYINIWKMPNFTYTYLLANFHVICFAISIVNWDILFQFFLH